MIKSILTQNEQTAPNAREMEILHRHFPQCFTNEGAFDIERFKAQIQESVNITHEGYDLNFLGRNYAKLLSSIDTTTVIVPDKEHNALPENTTSENIYISGDNLDGLKHLLKSYAGEVKCIYIDPPYNTGTDGFVYNDRFTFTAEELSAKLSISEEQAAKILDLTRRGSASHSAWLTFMACRLQLSRDLLTDDGLIFISIDDNEQANLKLLCDNIFGEENFVAKFDWRKKTGANDAKDIAVITESILLYARDKDLTVKNDIWKRDKDSINKDRYKYSDEFVETRGKFYYDTLDRGGLQYSDSMNFGIKAPDGGMIFPNGRSKFVNDGWTWKWGQEKIKWGIENKFLEFCKSDKSEGSAYTIKYKVYQNVDNEGNARVNFGRAYSNLITKPINQQGNSDFSSLFEGKMFFSNPKPIGLIQYLLNTNKNESSIILDFFSGSGTTAQAVMELNAEDGGNRRYIMVQLPEETPANSEARKAGYETIDQIGRERIRRAAAKIKAETGADIDYGFKHYTLAEPDSNTLDQLENFDPNAMFADETVLEKFGKSTVLETWLVRDGYGFGASANEVKLDGYTAYHYDKHLYLIDVEFTEKDLAKLIDRYNADAAFCPENIVIFGYSFTFTQTEMLRKNTVVLRDGDKNLKINIDVRY